MWDSSLEHHFIESRPYCFLCPRIDRSGAYSFWPVCLSVCWSVCPFVCPYNFYIGHILRLVRVTAFYNTILTFNDLKPLTDNKILDLSKLKQIADNILKCI